MERKEIILDAEPRSGPPPLPPPLPWNGWMTLLWMVAVMGLWIGIQSVLLLLFLGFEGGLTDLNVLEAKAEEIALDGDFLGLATVLTALLVCPFCLLLGRWRKGFSGLGYLGLRRPRVLSLGLWILATIGVGLLYNLVAPVVGVEESPEFMQDIVRSADLDFLLILGVVVAAPFVEEFVFRGLLFRGWRSSRLGLRGTLVVTSLLWTGLHLSQYNFSVLAYIFVLGILLGYARERTGNLWIPVAMHAVNNAIAMWESYRLAG